MNRFLLVSVCLFLLLMLGSCSSLSKPLSDDERISLSEAGGRSDLLDRMLAAEGNGKIDAILVYKDGKLVLERYSNGYDAETPHDIRSSTKALTAILVGIAIEKGMIQSVEQSILDFFPEQQVRRKEFKPIRIIDLLTMTSGLDSDDWNQASPGHEEKMYTKSSWIDFFFSLPVTGEPGKTFRYSTAGVVLLGELVKRASGLPFDQFAEKYLFQKLNITGHSFAKTPAGEIDSGGHLRIKPRDFAKMGLLVLQRGLWNGEQLVPETWIDKMVQPSILLPGALANGPYMGYLWWQEPVVNGEVRSFQTRGNGGQYLIAIPSQQLLGVFTGSAFNESRQMQPFLLMKDFVLPAFGE